MKILNSCVAEALLVVMGVCAVRCQQEADILSEKSRPLQEGQQEWLHALL